MNSGCQQDHVPSEALGKNLGLLLSSFLWLLTNPSIPGLVATSFQSLSLSSNGCFLSVSLHLLIRRPITEFRTQPYPVYFMLTNYISKDPISNKVTFLGFQEDVNLGECYSTQYNQYREGNSITGWEDQGKVQRETGSLRLNIICTSRVKKKRYFIMGKWL